MGRDTLLLSINFLICLQKYFMAGYKKFRQPPRTFEGDSFLRDEDNDVQFSEMLCFMVKEIENMVSQGATLTDARTQFHDILESVRKSNRHDIPHMCYSDEFIEILLDSLASESYPHALYFIHCIFTKNPDNNIGPLFEHGLIERMMPIVQAPCEELFLVLSDVAKRGSGPRDAIISCIDRSWLYDPAVDEHWIIALVRGVIATPGLDDDTYEFLLDLILHLMNNTRNDDRKLTDPEMYKLCLQGFLDIQKHYDGYVYWMIDREVDKELNIMLEKKIEDLSLRTNDTVSLQILVVLLSIMLADATYMPRFSLSNILSFLQPSMSSKPDATTNRVVLKILEEWFTREQSVEFYRIAKNKRVLNRLLDLFESSYDIRVSVVKVWSVMMKANPEAYHDIIFECNTLVRACEMLDSDDDSVISSVLRFVSDAVALGKLCNIEPPQIAELIMPMFMDYLSDIMENEDISLATKQLIDRMNFFQLLQIEM